MLKFFQQIRRKLLYQGNLSKYLVYAIGEVLLIMVGILLALQANNWNETRKTRREESKILVDLKGDFIRNHQDLMRVYNAKKTAEREFRDYLEMLAGDTLSIAQKAAVPRPAMADYTWDPNYPILNSLMSTGRLDYIQNDSLKYLLTSWNEAVESYLENQSEYRHTNLAALKDFESSRISIPVTEGGYTIASSVSRHITPFDVNKLREKVVMEISYHNLLGNCITRLYVQVLTANAVIDLSNHIQTLLEEEIRKKENGKK